MSIAKCYNKGCRSFEGSEYNGCLRYGAVKGCGCSDVVVNEKDYKILLYEKALELACWEVGGNFYCPDYEFKGGQVFKEACRSCNMTDSSVCVDCWQEYYLQKAGTAK